MLEVRLTEERSSTKGVDACVFRDSRHLSGYDIEHQYASLFGAFVGASEGMQADDKHKRVCINALALP